MSIYPNLNKKAIHRYLYLVHVKCLMENSGDLSEEDNINLGEIYNELNEIWYDSFIVSIESKFLSDIYNADAESFGENFINYILLNGSDFDLDYIEKMMMLT